MCQICFVITALWIVFVLLLHLLRFNHCFTIRALLSVSGFFDSIKKKKNILPISFTCCCLLFVFLVKIGTESQLNTI